MSYIASHGKEIAELKKGLQEAALIMADLAKEHGLLLDALKFYEEVFGPHRDEYNFSKRAAIDKGRSLIAQLGK